MEMEMEINFYEYVCMYFMLWKEGNDEGNEF